MTFDIYILSAILVGLTMLTLVVGYARVLFNTRSAAFHIALSTCLIFFSFAARAWFWDLAPVIDPAIKEVGVLHMDRVNTVFNLIAIWSALHGHYALYLMIPAEDKEKHHWNIFTAWMYPPWLLFHEFNNFARKLKWKKKE